MGRAALIEAQLPEQYLMESYEWSAYTRNRMAVRRHNKLVGSGDDGNTPFQLITDKIPSIKHLLPFGCIVFVNAPKHKRGSKIPWSHHAERRPSVLIVVSDSARPPAPQG